MTSPNSDQTGHVGLRPAVPIFVSHLYVRAARAVSIIAPAVFIKPPLSTLRFPTNDSLRAPFLVLKVRVLPSTPTRVSNRQATPAHQAPCQDLTRRLVGGDI